MILFDAIYINNGGGKVLLNLLIKEISKHNKTILFLLDERLENEFKNSKLNIIFIKASLIKRHQFYKKNENQFTKVFCFGNLPPSLKLSIPVYTYLHQKYYISLPKTLSFKEKIIFNIKTIIFKRLLINTSFVFVQSELMKQEFIKKYKFDYTEVMPFFEDLTINSDNIKQKNNFLYPSLASLHKNHINLIEAFCLFNKKQPHSVLHLTVSNENSNVLQLITTKINEGFSIINHGFVSENDKIKLYEQAEFVVFPSFTESFGLGLIEAVQFNCKVITSDLNYVYEVIKPSITFNPFSIEDISKKLFTASESCIPNSELLVKNKLNQIISLLLEK